MALVSCPECNKQVSDKAMTCVGCGYPLKVMEVAEVITTTTTSVKDKVKRKSVNEQKIPFYILSKNGIDIAVNILEEDSGSEIRQLLDSGFEIKADNVMADSKEIALKYFGLGFTWWNIWGALGLIFGVVYFFMSLSMGDSGVFGMVVSVLSVLGCVLVLRMNKYAFLILTVLSINPLLWIANGIYLKNRWKHPNVN
jgi:hypothetical protein